MLRRQPATRSEAAASRRTDGPATSTNSARIGRCQARSGRGPRRARLFRPVVVRRRKHLRRRDPNNDANAPGNDPRHANADRAGTDADNTGADDTGAAAARRDDDRHRHDAFADGDRDADGAPGDGDGHTDADEHANAGVDGHRAASASDHLGWHNHLRREPGRRGSGRCGGRVQQERNARAARSGAGSRSASSPALSSSARSSGWCEGEQRRNGRTGTSLRPPPLQQTESTPFGDRFRHRLRGHLPSRRSSSR